MSTTDSLGKKIIERGNQTTKPQKIVSGVEYADAVRGSATNKRILLEVRKKYILEKYFGEKYIIKTAGNINHITKG